MMVQEAGGPRDGGRWIAGAGVNLNLGGWWIRGLMGRGDGGTKLSGGQRPSGEGWMDDGGP